jgi:4-amino-4-deoxy-L-arabinose transferase-like glycosyltransferase
MAVASGNAESAELTPGAGAGAPRGRTGRLSRARLAVPGPLATLLVIVVAVGLAWALLVPPWQSPDELNHFAYAQSLAERFALPGDPHRGIYSTDEVLGARAVGASTLSFWPKEVKPDWSVQDYRSYLAEARQDPSRSDGGGANPVAYEPPLFYLYSDLAYWATYPGNVFDRYYAMRIWGVSLLVLTVLGTWLLIGEAIGRRRLPQLAGSAVVGLLPMEAFISTSINPDALMIVLWTLAFWLGTRVVKYAARTGDVLALCAATAAAVLTQPTSYALVPASALALVLGWVRSERRERRARARALVLGALTVAIPVVAWHGFAASQGNPLVANVAAAPGVRPRPFNVRQFLSYVWQFYLPRLPFQSRQRATPGLPLYEVWLRGGWGKFGWLDVSMPSWVYLMTTVFTAAIAAASAWIIARFRDPLRLSLFAFYAVGMLALLFGLHLTEFRSFLDYQGTFLQGRYILPLIGLFGLAVALVVSRLPVRAVGAVCGALLAAMLLLQVIALGTIVGAYYT